MSYTVALRPNILILNGLVFILALAIITFASWRDTLIPTNAVFTLVPFIFAYMSLQLAYKRFLQIDGRTRSLANFIFLAHLLIALCLNQLWWWPNADLLGGDKWLYEQFGWRLASEGMSYTNIIDLTVQDLGVSIYVGVIYMLWGHNPMAVAIFNSLIAALAGIQIYKLSYRYGGAVTSRKAMLLWMLLPGILILSSFPNKEILVSFLCLYITNQVWAMLDGMDKNKKFRCLWHLALVTGATLICIGIRSLLMIPLGVIVVLQCWLRRSSFRNAAIGILMTVVLLVIGTAFINWREDIDRQILISPLPVQAAFMERLGFTFESVESSLTLRTYWALDWNRAYWIPLRIPLTIYVPFPPVSFHDQINAWGSINVWALFLLTPGMLGAFKPKRCGGDGWRFLGPVWLPILVVGTALSAGLPYMQWRYAAMAYPYMIILAVIGYGGRNKDFTRRMYLPVALILSVAVFIYLTLKAL